MKLGLLIAAAFCLPGAADSKKITDAESASHADASAFPQGVKAYEFNGFKVVQFNLAVLSHYSYVLASGGEAVVIDPCRDIDIYLDLANKENLKIKGLILTHSHADFVAGHIELVRATACPVYQSAASGAGYPIEGMKEGSVLQVGQAKLLFMETPGHTPDGMCVAVSGSTKNSPTILFTGDTLFVGSVGRPDLMGGSMSAASLASMMFDTWTGKLAKLPDEVIVLPTHGAGSLCGAHLSDEPSSTIGAERNTNSYLQHRSRSEFIAAVLDGLPEAPQYFKHNAALNRKGPDPVDWKAPPPAEMTAAASLSDPAQHYVVDLRPAAEYAAAHIAGSVNIALRGRLETWVGIMVPWDAKLVLLGKPEEVKEAGFRLHRVGYRPAGTIGLDSWQKAGLPIARNETVKPLELYRKMQDGTAPVIVDVRLPNEWMGLRIGTVVNLPLSHLAELSAQLDPAQPVVAICNSAFRSSMAVGILERKGFQHASSLEGGSEAWIEAGLPTYGGSKTTASSPASRRHLQIAERISASDLKRLLMDLPGTFELVDIRPPEHFADYSLPGSRNMDLADLLADAALLAGPHPLVIVDRDGSLAMMAAGILSQKTGRPIKALHGGLEAYWQEDGMAPAFRSPGTAAPAAPAGRSAPSVRPAPTGSPAAPAAPSPSTKKKSAGC
jgi:hydroxyacylglutathione hydrolase